MPAEIAAIASIAKDLTVTGLLLIGVWAFYRGKVLSKDAVDHIIRGVLTDLGKEMRGAVKDGMMDAHNEINGKGGETT